MMPKAFEQIPSEDLEERRLYVLYSRNLVIGVLNPNGYGFIGIREDFGNEFLSTETAAALSALDVFVPQDIQISEYLGTITLESQRFIYFRQDNPPAPTGKRYYVDDDSLCTEPFSLVRNKALFEFLKPYDEVQVEIENSKLPWHNH